MLFILKYILFICCRLQGTVKAAIGKLSDLDDSLDSMKPVSCDSKTIRLQLEEVKSLEAELASKEDTMAQLETQCLRHSVGNLHTQAIFRNLSYTR